jgi:Sugar (pentulose and hexulose) kinases
MKYGPLALSYDYGTQSVRAILFDKQGEIRAKVKLDFKQPYFSEKPGYAEQTPDFYWGQFCRVTNRLKEDVGELWNDIVTLSVTTFRDTVTCLDKDLKPLRPFILYLDQRRVENPLDYLPSGKKTIFKMVGMIDTVAAQYAATFFNWIKINEPDIWAKTYKCVSLSTYLNLKMLGELVDSKANQIGHFPFNYKKGMDG